MVHVAPPGGWTPKSIHPEKWADQMLKAWKVATYHKAINLEKRDLSLTDIDKAEPGELVNTPRSLQACILLGIDPEEILFRDFAYFTERGLSKEFQGMKFAYFEKERKAKIERLLQERNRIIAEKNDGEIFIENGQIKSATTTGGVAGSGADSRKPSDSAAAALKKAEAAKRRAEKERARKEAAELATKRMLEDAKRVAEAQAKKEAGQKAAKAKKDKEFALQQAALEAKKRAEEEQLEKDATALVARQYAEQLKLAAERKVAARKAKKAAMLAAKERAAKQDAFQKELQIMAEKVAQAAIERNNELMAKDVHRKKRLEMRNEEFKKRNELLRAEAEKRQATALQAYYDALQKKKDDFDAKTAASAARRAILQLEMDKQLKEKIMMQKQAEEDRKQTLQRAQDQRENHIQEILKKANAKAKLFKEYIMRREKERLQRNVQSNLEYSKAMNVVNQTTRKQAFHRRQLLSHIEKQTEKIRHLMEIRMQIQKARQLAEAQTMWAQGKE